jgi:hypothetical protein
MSEAREQPKSRQTDVRLYAATLTARQLGSLATGENSLFHLMILANVDEIHFERFHTATLSDPSRWQEGHIFGPDAELRWRRRGEQYRVTLRTESPGATLAWPHPPTSLLVSAEWTEQQLRLWGEHRPENVQDGAPFWLETQVPRLLYYPLSGAPVAVALAARLYTPLDGTSRFVRFLDLVPWSPAS